MTEIEPGIVSLYESLVDHHLPNEKHCCRLLLLRSDRIRKKKKLLSTTYDILLFKSRAKAHDQKSNRHQNAELGEMNQLLSHVFSLRWNRKFDAASSLENLAERIEKSVEESDSVRAMVRMILKLAGSGTDPAPDSGMPVVCHSTKSNVRLPLGPQFYGESRVHHTDSSFYTMYSNEAFRPKFSPLEISDFNANLLKLMPGKGVSKFFSREEEEAKGNRNSRTLFGALIESRASAVSLWTKLEIPSIEDGSGSLQIRVPCLSPTLTDEGLQTGNDSCDSTVTESSDTDIWTEALNLPPTKLKQSWDSAGSHKPYLTECGVEAVNHLYWYNQDLLTVLDSTHLQTRQLYVTVKHLLRDVTYLLIGLPSRIFIFDPSKKEFQIHAGICVSGTTPEAMKAMLEPFLECGSLYFRLERLSVPPTLNSFYTKGLIYQAFTTSIRKYLRFYEAFVLSLAEDSILATLNRCHYVFKQMQFLAEFCQVTGDANTENWLPTGLKLLSYIHKHTLSSTATANYRLLLSILKTTAVPYIHFLQRWVYHGACHDPYEEFMIKVHNDFLYCRDKYYWGQGYELVHLDLDSSIPIFLNEILTEIFNCGKAINLLKLCCPGHFMCNIPHAEVPKLTITYDVEELERIQVNTGAYVSRVEQVARRNLVSRNELLERAERTRFDLILKGRKDAHERMEQAREEKMKILATIHEKKRKELLELKLGMEKDKERREEIIATQHAEEKAYIESVMNQDKQKTDLQLRLEEQAREELIAQYERMTAEALLRERRALWKIERAKLTLERNSMLRKEEIDLKKEFETFLKTSKEKENVDAIAVSNEAAKSEELVEDHVSESMDGEVSVAVGNLLDITLSGLTSPGVTSHDGAVFDGNLLDTTVPDLGPSALLDDMLPKWAQSDRTTILTEDRPMPKWAQSGIVNEMPVVVSDDLEESELMPTESVEHTSSVSALDVEKVTPRESSSNGQAPRAKPVKRAIEESVESERKSSTKAVSGRHIGQTNFSLRDFAPETYTFTVTSLRPVDEIISESPSDISFEICRRTSVYFTQDRETERKSESCGDTNAQKFKNVNKHGSHPSQMSETEIKLPSRGKPSKITQESSPASDTRLLRFKEQNIHGHASDSQVKIEDGTSEKRWMTEKQEAFKPNQLEIVANFEEQKVKQNHVSDESPDMDLMNLRIKKFQQHNKQGHSTRSAKSSVQTLLYGESFGTRTSPSDTGDSKSGVDEEEAPKFSISPVPWLGSGIEQYRDNYDEVREPPNRDMANRVYRTSSSYENVDAEDTSAQHHISLPVLINRSLVSPILAQISLTNRSLLTYFFLDLTIDRHFEALKLFMFLEDGEFGQTLGDILFEKLAHNPLPHEVFNTVFLSGALLKALRASSVACTMSEYLLLGNKFLPKLGDMNGPRALDCLDLHYQIDWPLNIVITDSCLLRYNMIFCFMLQLKRVAWCLNDIWHRLKRDALNNLGADLRQFRTLQLYRHEMQNFVRVIQSYLSNQIIHVSWGEFQQDLRNRVHTLDDLHDVHALYLNKATFRCLLSKKAGSMMKVIQDVLGLILRFHSQLLSAGWQRDGDAVTHPSYEVMKRSYRSFRDYSMFLFKVIRKVTARGYQPHLEELLLRLNFNAYYTTRQRLD